MHRTTLASLLIFGPLFGGPAPAHAHVVGLSYADVMLAADSAHVILRVPAKGLAEHFQLRVEGDSPTGAAVLRVGAETLAAFFRGKIEIINRDRACQASRPELQPDADAGRIRVGFTFSCSEPLGDVGIHLYFFNEFGPPEPVNKNETAGS